MASASGFDQEDARLRNFVPVIAYLTHIFDGITLINFGNVALNNFSSSQISNIDVNDGCLYNSVALSLWGSWKKLNTSKKPLSHEGSFRKCRPQPRSVCVRIHEDARTVLTTKLPAKRVFRGVQLSIIEDDANVILYFSVEAQTGGILKLAGFS